MRLNPAGEKGSFHVIWRTVPFDWISIVGFGGRGRPKGIALN